MISKIVKDKNYIAPLIERIDYKSCEIQSGLLGHKDDRTLFVDGKNMNYTNLKSLITYYEHLVDYNLAYGHCICTGLGFLIRESLLLSNPKVDKITVLEISQDLIDLQYQMNPKIMNHPKINVICIDANEYIGECDFLSIDHYNDPTNVDEIHDTITKLTKNIKHKVMWYWTLLYDINGFQSVEKRYASLREKYNTLPKLNFNELLEYILLTDFKKIKAINLRHL